MRLATGTKEQFFNKTPHKFNKLAERRFSASLLYESSHISTQTCKKPPIVVIYSKTQLLTTLHYCDKIKHERVK